MTGNITQPNSEPSAQKNSEIYLMDIRNFTWVNTFDVQKTTDKIPIKPKNKNTENTIKIVIATICAIIGTGIISICGIFIYRWQRTRRELQDDRHLSIPGTIVSESNNSHYKLPVAAEYKI
ncbi:8638_t:CDS:1 [Funneliformis mosseae]|uniref:8638_t:CDS:1 n=1 Tax=Funneliformis mosseae TaxID=27381 RepID=A0A9N9B7H8_FUNMO|nr:8638_t:CDS:1 [Funneliformis mosseae]